METLELKKTYKPRWLRIDMARHALGIRILDISDSRTDRESLQIGDINDRILLYGKLAK